MEEFIATLKSIDQSLKVIAARLEGREQPVNVTEKPQERPRKRAPKGDYSRRKLYPHDIIMRNAGMKINITRFRVACANLGISPEESRSGSNRWYIPKKAIPAVVEELRSNLL